MARYWNTHVRVTVSKGGLDYILKKLPSNIRASCNVGEKVTEEIVKDAAAEAKKLYGEAHYDGSLQGLIVSTETDANGHYRVVAEGQGVRAIEYGTSRPGYWFYTKKPGNQFTGDIHEGGGANAHYRVSEPLYKNLSKAGNGKIIRRSDIQKAWDDGKIKRSRTIETRDMYSGKTRYREKRYRDIDDYIFDRVSQGLLDRVGRGKGEEVENPNSAITQGNTPNHVMGKTAEWIAEQFPARAKPAIAAALKK